MGCLTKIIKAVILCFAFIGFVSIGGDDFVKSVWNKYITHNVANVEKRASKIGDFSEIGEEFEISKSASLFGYNGVLAEHKSSKQKMIILDAKKGTDILTAEDIKNDKVEEKITKLSKKFKPSALRIQDLKLGSKGTMSAYGKSVPYVKFSAKISKMPFGDVDGIISAYEDDGNNKLLISVNERNKYSQIVAQEFFKKVKK